MGLILSPRLNLHDPYGLPQENLAQLVRSNAKSLPKFVTVKPRKVSCLVAYGVALASAPVIRGLGSRELSPDAVLESVR